MKAVGRPQKWTKMWRSGRKSVGARYLLLYGKDFYVPSTDAMLHRDCVMLTCFGTIGTSSSTLSTFNLALFAFSTDCLSTNSEEHWLDWALFIWHFLAAIALLPHNDILKWLLATEVSYHNESFFIKMRAAFLLSPSFITQGRMGARKVALILMKHSLW